MTDITQGLADALDAAEAARMDFDPGTDYRALAEAALAYLSNVSPDAGPARDRYPEYASDCSEKGYRRLIDEADAAHAALAAAQAQLRAERAGAQAVTNQNHCTATKITRPDGSRWCPVCGQGQRSTDEERIR